MQSNVRRRQLRRRRRYALTGGAVVLLILLAAYVAWLGPKPKPGTQLTKLDPAAVDAVSIQRGGAKIQLQRDANGDWQITQPLSWPAGYRTADLVAGAASFRAERTLDPQPSNLGNYGLDPPRVTLRLKTGKGKSATLEIGNKTTTGDGYYVQVAGDQALYLGAYNAVSPLDLQLSDLRDRDVTHFDQSDVEQVQLVRTGKQPLTLELVHDQDAWRITRPFADRADSTQIGSLLQAVSGLQIDGFVDDQPKDLAQYGLDKPRETIRLTLASKGDDSNDKPHVLTLLVGKEKSQGVFYLQTSARPSVFTINNSAFMPLTVTAADLLDDQLLNPYPDDVSKLRVSQAPDGTATGTLSRTGTTWSLGDKPVADPSIDAFFGTLRKLDIKARADDQDAARAALKKPALSIQITDTTASDSRTGSHTLTIAPYKEGDVAVTSDRPGVYTVDPKAVDTILDSWRALQPEQKPQSIGASTEADSGQTTA